MRGPALLFAGLSAGRAAVVVLLSVMAQHALCDAPPGRTPEECLSSSVESAASTAELAGKEYRFRFSECATEFRTDPERFAQLYDAIEELRASGKPPAAPSSVEPASLVPS